MNKKLEKVIIEVLTDLSCYAEKDHYIEAVIVEKEPFFWRINPKWAREVANEIIKKLERV